MKHPTEFEKEAKKLVQQMSLEEKTSLMSGGGFWKFDKIERLDLPSIIVTDGPNGLRKMPKKADHLGLGKSVPATCFPSGVVWASSWDRKLVREVGEALGRESQDQNVGVLLGPAVNIKRSPLCGRNFEYLSEDPYQAGEMAKAYTSGLQSAGIGTSIKHFAANNQEAQRMVVDTLVDRRTLFEIYLPAFEAVVEAERPWTVMCAYNRLNGIYCAEHEDLLGDILRDRFGFEGIVITDWTAINDRVRGLRAGIEVEMPASGGVNDKRVAKAVEEGTLPVEILDRAASLVTAVILAAKHNATGKKADYAANHAFARRVAAEAAVLLKNEDALLPFSKKGKLAVIGAFAETPRFQGAGSAEVNAIQTDASLTSFREVLGEKNVVYAAGYDPETAEDNPALIAEAVEAAKSAKRVVLHLGLPPIFESEAFDRETLAMPPQMDALAEAVLAANPNCVVVLANGSPISMPWVDKANAILEMYLTGQAGGGALTDVIFGDVEPSGRLAETFPIALEDSPSQENFASHPRQIIYREGLNIGYRYFITHDKPVLFPFGHGLGYTQFSYGEPRLVSAEGELPVRLALDITNTGKREGAAVVQLYVRDVESSAYRPDRELKGFEKLVLKPKEKKEVEFTLGERAFAFFDVAQDGWQIEAGAFEILLGASSTDIRQSLSVKLPASPGAKKPAKEAPYRVMDDAALTALGLQITAPETLRPFHMNSMLGDVRDTFAGRMLYRLVDSRTKRIMGETDDSLVMSKMKQEMINSMRLSTIYLMSGFSEKQFDLILMALNNEWGGFVNRLLWNRK